MKLLLRSPEAHFSKPRKLLSSAKLSLDNLYLKTERCIHMPETPCMKRTSVHIKNNLCKHNSSVIIKVCIKRTPVHNLEYEYKTALYS